LSQRTTSSAAEKAARWPYSIDQILTNAEVIDNRADTQAIEDAATPARDLDDPVVASSP
jgi:hypothetical protein